MNLLKISTDHLSWDDQNFLDAGHPGLEEVFSASEGWIIRVQSAKGLSEQFAGIFKEAARRDADYIMIRYDGERIHGLKIFED